MDFNPLHVPDDKKLIVYGGIVAALAGLYVLYQRTKNGTTTTDTGTGTGVGTVSTTQDLSGITSSFSGALSSLNADNKTANDALSSLIAQEAQGTVNAINDQTGGIKSAIGSLNNASGLSALQDAQAAQTKTITDAINAGFTAQGTAIGGITSAFTDANSKTNDAINTGLKAISDQNSSLVSQITTMITNALGGVSSALTQQLQAFAAQEAQGIATQTGILNGLTSSISSQSNEQYLQIGLHSAAACFRNGGLHLDCVNNSAQDYTPRTQAGTGDGSNRNIYSSDLPSVLTSLQSEYSSCFKNDHYDLACVGRLMSTRYGGN